MKLTTIKAQLANLRFFDKWIHCPYCHSTNTKIILWLSPKALRECPNCSLIFLYPQIPPEALSDAYNKNYAIAGFDIKQIEQITLSKLRDTCFNRDREINLLLEFKQSGMVLDLGCSWGFCMLQAKHKGFMVKGIEISRPHARYAIERLGLDVSIGQLYEASYPDGYFVAILASHVLEHIPNLRRTLNEMHRILQEDGVAIIIVPNFSSFSRKMLGLRWKWLEPNWHCYQFTKGFLQYALDETGFDVTFRSEEGHYGKELIESLYSQEEIQAIHQRLEGSELIAIARKR